ncbi:melanocortin-2 receptor accessory protein 2A isoform X1 [Paramormyrops kingsleyae]|uniref:melanocortin-2 receptor accessory protein 2A isoform X1 n=2 Tax=Paramormyrops kingsleyae TaxID=1676925 RepID=UPI000CD5D14C|nr:melanocortin-2 receptor accessory protein 2 isoform X1 [Paramormyrops kingsleyae]
MRKKNYAAVVEDRRKIFLNFKESILEMSDFNHLNKSRSSGRGPEYVWEYEYYDDEEPVSFEGLKAHRYSVVIGFWVGLAVFVIFMFFVLTLLTKTGAPHQENLEACDKHPGLTSCVVDISHDQGSGSKVCSHSLMEESHSIFRCSINEEEQCEPVAGHQGYQGRLSVRTSSDVQGEPMGLRKDREANFLQHFNIPNFVNSEHSSVLGDDDLLLCEQPIIMDSETRCNSKLDIIS